MREFSQPVRAVTKQQCFSDDSSERLWLVIAFISSAESYVIGYNTQRCKNASGSVPARESRFEFSSWWCFFFSYRFQKKLSIAHRFVWCDMIPNIGRPSLLTRGHCLPPRTAQRERVFRLSLNSMHVFFSGVCVSVCVRVGMFSAGQPPCLVRQFAV